MATFDQLSAEQRAIVELILKQGKSYEELGSMLGMPASRVRELAREALVKLSPVSARAVDDEWRGQIADYLLNQQSGPEGTATKGHLRRSEEARGWSRSVLDSLDQFYSEGFLPTIPSGEPAAKPRRERRPKREKPEKAAAVAAPAAEAEADEDSGDEVAAKERSPRPAASMSPTRAWLVVGGPVALVIILVAVLLWPIGLLTGSDDDSKPAPRNAAAQTRVLGQLQLQPVARSGAGSRAAGVALFVQRGNTRSLVVSAQVTAVKRGQAYEVWLYNSRRDARSLGAQVTDSRGALQGAATLPNNLDISKYRYVDISLEKIDRNKAHSNDSVLRGALRNLQAPQQEQQQGGGATAPQSTTPAAPQSTTPAVPQTTTPGQ